MSFKNLQKERKNRQNTTKSFIKAISISEERQSLVAIDKNDSRSDSNQAEVVHYHGLYEDLGPSLEIRTSSERGRGLYVNRSLRKGLYRHIRAQFAYPLALQDQWCFGPDHT